MNAPLTITSQLCNCWYSIKNRALPEGRDPSAERRITRFLPRA
ncbi:hypothetical protein SAMN05421755_103532 [Nitrosomonas sp. Nm33]|nr:hypothetical protein SAMN05421755_103532 [Nitrosomonas sp. Nm33]